MTEGLFLERRQLDGKNDDGIGLLRNRIIRLELVRGRVRSF